MKKTLLVLLAAGAALSMATTASASGGCGRGMHRSPHGHCRPNGGPARGVVVAPGLVIGNFYRGQGYWDGQRYYQHRERFNGGWRYR